MFYSYALSHPIIDFLTLVVADIFLSLAFFRRHPSFRLAIHVVFFLCLTVLLISDGIRPYEPNHDGVSIAESLLASTAKAAWWIGGAMMLVSLVRLLRSFKKRTRESRLMQDILVGTIYLGACLSVIAYVFGVPVGTVFATSGVFAVILGLALQSTLNDVFSGIALNLGRAYSVGDWIELSGGIKGRVVETNWRATYLLNGTNDLIVIPNSALAKTDLTNLSTPDESHGISITIKIAANANPAFIEQVMHTVLLSSNKILKSPSASVTIMGLDNSAITVELACRVADRAQASAAKNELYDLAYRHTRAAALTFAGGESSTVGNLEPTTTIASTNQLSQNSARRLLNSVTLFASLADDEKEALSKTMTRKTFPKNSVIAEQSSKLSSLMIVRSGVLLVTRLDDDIERELTRLAPGDFFGEGGVLAATEEIGNVKSLTFTVVYEIGQEALGSLMKARPAIADELGMILCQRLEAERSLVGSFRHPLNDNHLLTLTERIRHLFDMTRTL